MTENESSTVVLRGNGISLFRLKSLEGRMAFELRTGIQTSRGKSIFSIVKEEFGLKGNKQKVFAAFQQIIADAASKLKKGDITTK